MSNPYRDKLLSIGIISSRSRPTVSEGRHAATGIKYKMTTDADGATTVDHDLGVGHVAPVENPASETRRTGPVTLADLEG